MIRKIMVLAVVLLSVVSSTEIFAFGKTGVEGSEVSSTEIDSAPVPDRLDRSGSAAGLGDSSGSEEYAAAAYYCRNIRVCTIYNYCTVRRVCYSNSYSENEVQTEGIVSN